jgi:elongation factor P--beta-lysine ligase
MHIITHPENKVFHQIYLKVQAAIQDYLSIKGYLPVELPVLSPALIPESYIEVFETEFTYLDHKEKMYLTPSPELFLKRLITSGIGDCYYLGKSFRNSEPTSPKHNPEFTMLEFYKVGKDYIYIADEVLGMFQHIAKQVLSADLFTFKGKQVSLSKYEKMTVAQAFTTFADIPESVLFDEKAFLQKAQEKGYTTHGFSYEDLFSQIYTQEIEPHLGTNGYPLILCDYPAVFAPLSLPNADGLTAQRFEIYIEGVELGNCYGELTDPKLQKIRFEKEAKMRHEAKKIEHPVDYGFIEALEKGMPACSGIAMGVGRLAMIVADIESLDRLQLITIE